MTAIIVRVLTDFAFWLVVCGVVCWLVRYGWRKRFAWWDGA